MATIILCLFRVVSCQYLCWSGLRNNPPSLPRSQHVFLIANNDVTENADDANDDVADPAATDDDIADDADDAALVNGLLRA